MDIFNKLFKRKRYYPEGDYKVTITPKFIKVEHPKRREEQIFWDNIEEIKLINTDNGPFVPDIWLSLFGKEDGCLIPHGAKGFDEIYEVVSKYEGFNKENFGKSMTCTDNAEFLLWRKH